MIRTHQQRSKRCKALASQVQRMMWFLAVTLLLSPVPLEAQDWAGGALTWTCSTIEAITNKAALQGIRAAVNAAVANAAQTEQNAKIQYDATQRAQTSASAAWSANEAQIKQRVQSADADKARYQAEINEKLPQWQALRDQINSKTQALADVQQKLQGGWGRLGGGSALQLQAQYEAERDQLQKDIAQATAQKQQFEGRLLELQSWIRNTDQQLATDIAPLVDNGNKLQARLQDTTQALEAARQAYNQAQAYSASVNAAALTLQDCITQALQALDKPPSPPSNQQGNVGGYDPRTDPGMGGGPPNIPGALGGGQQFQGSAPWGSAQQPPIGQTQPGQPQPSEYTGTGQPPGAQPPGAAGTQPPYPCGVPGYPPCPPGYGGPPVVIPWGGLVPGGTPPTGGGGQCPPGCHLKPDGSGCHCPGAPVNPCAGG